MYIELPIRWHDVTPGRTCAGGEQVLYYNPHPRDYDIAHFEWRKMIEFMGGREADLAQMVAHLGDSENWSSRLDWVDPYGDGSRATIRVCVRDLGAVGIATLDTTGKGDSVTDVAVVIQQGRIAKFTPAQIRPAICSLTEKDQKAVLLRTASVLNRHRGGSLVLWISAAPGPDGSFEAIQDFGVTLVRAMLKWSTLRDRLAQTQATAARAVAGRGRAASSARRDSSVGRTDRQTGRRVPPHRELDATVAALVSCIGGPALHLSIDANPTLACHDHRA